MPFHQLSNPRNSIIDRHKANGLKVIDERVKWYCSLCGFNPMSVKVADEAKRWGSCGPRNTPNFSWRLVKERRNHK
ncbi:MAG: M48 family metallopeptidase [Bacillota bacterium]